MLHSSLRKKRNINIPTQPGLTDENSTDRDIVEHSYLRI